MKRLHAFISLYFFSFAHGAPTHTLSLTKKQALIEDKKIVYTQSNDRLIFNIFLPLLHLRQRGIWLVKDTIPYASLTTIRLNRSGTKTLKRHVEKYGQLDLIVHGSAQRFRIEKKEIDLLKNDPARPNICLLTIQNLLTKQTPSNV